jgi:hypothetical protein
VSASDGTNSASAPFLVAEPIHLTNSNVIELAGIDIQVTPSLDASGNLVLSVQLVTNPLTNTPLGIDKFAYGSSASVLSVSDPGCPGGWHINEGSQNVDGFGDFANYNHCSAGDGGVSAPIVFTLNGIPTISANDHAAKFVVHIRFSAAPCKSCSGFVSDGTPESVSSEPGCTPYAPEVTTLLSESEITLGGSVTDTVTVTGLPAPFPSPTGSVEFYVSSDDGATWTPFSTKSLDASGKATSDSYTPSAVGTYYFKAKYLGGNYPASESGDKEEPLKVEPSSGQPVIRTSLSLSEVPVGTAVRDFATLEGVPEEAAGTIVFRVFSGSDDACTLGTELYTSDPIGVSGPETYGPSAPDFVPTSVGTYRWQAFYDDDASDIHLMSLCSDEILTVIKTRPSIVTSVSPSKITLGTLPDSATDTATLSGGLDPTGTITFKAYGPSETDVCTEGNLVFTYTVTNVKGNGPYTSGPFKPTDPGKYWWVASYSGDGNNEAVSDTCGAQYEVLAVEPPSGQGEEMPPVGGEVYSVNKPALLSPYLALLALFGAVGVAFAMRRHRDA